MNIKPSQQTFTCLRLILGDQLNAKHSWYKEKNSNTLYVIAELHQETRYVVHHVQKVCAFFAAMEQFASALTRANHQVLHLTLNDTVGYSDLPELLKHLISVYSIQKFEYQLPDEFRLREQLNSFVQQTAIPTFIYETEHFYLTDKELPNYFSKGKRHRMEAFYRKMRHRFQVLMNGDLPAGGQWNFDANNRKKIKPEHFINVPQPLLFANNISVILSRLNAHNIKTIGKTNELLLWPINRTQARELLNYFCRFCLPNFGHFQDAMTSQLDKQRLLGEDSANKQWSLFHSRLSFALNTKMISPHEVIQAALLQYKQAQGAITVSQIEGFVRQILGWREFVRGIYWANMPSYGQLNYLSATRPLPHWFWHGKTKMNCMSHAIHQSLDYAYAHHIQRLMVTGNFCLLTGISPTEVDQWYLGIYIDAIEWVEMPNTRGMSQFADGGIVGSKAYAASGNYINKMSDYCSSCHYNVSKTTESNACPLNSLYWNFIQQHQNLLGSNPRNSLVYVNWEKKTTAQQANIINRSNYLLAHLNEL